MSRFKSSKIEVPFWYPGSDRKRKEEFVLRAQFMPRKTVLPAYPPITQHLGHPCLPEWHVVHVMNARAGASHMIPATFTWKWRFWKWKPLSCKCTASSTKSLRKSFGQLGFLFPWYIPIIKGLFLRPLIWPNTGQTALPELFDNGNPLMLANNSIGYETDAEAGRDSSWFFSPSSIPKL